MYVHLHMYMYEQYYEYLFWKVPCIISKFNFMLQSLQNRYYHSASWRKIIYPFDSYDKHGYYSWTFLFNGELLYGNKYSESVFICPCHLFTNDFSDGDYVYCTSKMMMRGPCRNFSEPLPRETLWETGSIRNPSNTTATCIRQQLYSSIHLLL